MLPHEPGVPHQHAQRLAPNRLAHSKIHAQQQIQPRASVPRLRIHKDGRRAEPHKPRACGRAAAADVHPIRRAWSRAGSHHAQGIAHRRRPGLWVREQGRVRGCVGIHEIPMEGEMKRFNVKILCKKHTEAGVIGDIDKSPI